MEPQTIQIKDIIFNIVKTKKKIEALKRDLAMLESQVDQQQKFLEESVVDEILQRASVPAEKPQKDKT
ncbi:hypothetical protein AYK24_00260 [Thermoplasmatales archaeon SG8-52-4]|nr:MAG: hypothetical protein AYK24_00260 [Thermoplasmatales archaeon SG8-52-4]